MKTSYKLFLLVAAVSIALTGCAQKEVLDTPKDGELATLKFNIRNSDEGTVTKALLGTDENGKKFLNWENGDKIGTFSVGTFGEQTTSNNNAGTVEVSGDDYTLNVQTFTAGSVTDIYSYFPYSSAAGKEKASAIITIPATQHLTSNGFDADAMPMAGEPAHVSLSTIANTDKPCGTINFSNLGSIVVFRVYTSGSSTETLTSVTYKATGIGGDFSIDLTGVNANDETTLALTASQTVGEITTIVEGAPAIGDLDHAIDVYMVVAPGTYNSSQVVVTTNAKTYTLTATNAKSYERSHIKPMKVDISKGTPGDLPTTEIWTKVTRASDFTAGTYYILRADGAYYVPNSTGNPSCVSYKTGDPITQAMKWTATANGSGLEFESVANAGYYLWTTNTGSANTISVTQSSTGASASKIWTFASVEANETTYYTATAGASKYLVSYGNSNWRYYGKTNITASNIPAEFYKLEAGDVPQKDTPELAFNNPTTTVNVGENVTNVATITPSDLAITYSSSDEDVATVTDAGVVTGVAAGTATITAAFAGNDEYNAVSATYDITVTDPNANDGSAEKPYTASEAVTVVKSGSTQTDAFVKGIISKITTAYNSQYGNVSFDISNDGLTSGDQFRIFRAEASSADDFKVGDAVTFKGNILYYNNQTPEMEQGNELISQLHAPVLSPANGTTESVTITADQGATIRYTTDGSNPTVENGIVYSTAITISAATTIKAIALKDGVVTGVVSGEFSIPVAGEYVLDGTKVGGNSGYAEASSIIQSEISWKVEGNTTMNPWRIGGKSLDGVDRTIYSEDPIPFNVESIEITHGAASSITVNSMTVIVASDEGFSTIVSTLTPTFAANNTVTVNRPANANWSNCYYKIVYNVSVTVASNKFVEFKKAKFTGH